MTPWALRCTCARTISPTSTPTSCTDQSRERQGTHLEGSVVGNSAFTSASSTRICELIAKHRLPAIADGRQFAEGGVLLTYSTDCVELYKRGADYVTKILRGAKPGDLPIEHASRYVFVVNLKAAKTLGIRIRQNMLLMADSVIS